MAREEGFFDELARGLADGTLTRGKALRLMGAALVGGSLASLGIREAGADPPGCKRAGKHCTRDTQCCGSLVCVSGTCQTPTTSTTETPTTSTTETPTTPTNETPTTTTTETPTTTTTETPTTTTTPMCIPNGGTCTAGGTQCCSGNCNSNGFCCPTGYVGLSNGTCAKPCTKGGDDCPGCAALCAEDVDGVSGCSSGFVRCSGNTDCLSGMCDPTSGICRCTDHTGCPSGQFCVGGTCQIAC
jgi:hypothetical protein